jgi:hypothetical protein
MPDESPLTLESALSFMRVDPSAPAPEPEDKSAAPDTAAPSEDNSAPAQDDTPPADVAAADTDTPQSDEGETNEGSQDPGDALPPIEAPSSWSTEEKAEWNSLSRKAQEAVLRREQDNTKALRNAQNATAESNKKADAEVTRLKNLAEQFDGYLNEKVADLAREFPEVKSEADLVTLATNDPARAQLFNAKLQALAAANGARANAQRELAQKAEQQHQANLADAKEKLIEAFPSWKDPDVARREVIELQDYAIKEMGVPEAAARNTLDPVIYKLTQKAMLYDRAQAKAKAALTRTPPRSVPPGAQNQSPRTVQRDDSRRSQIDRLGKSGDIDDARGLLRV